ncbi:hypothetical protein COU57_06740 [Candidatus Pacearchaeota archaeon CG10_big_fil_rev_8_21_14_0_10_32_14]|nr:MAG: hypothetical protein COU57_06740 [Candidatus Pacearchaeota archaeon CG10_big_fil_rev_8_21_14_0_10_32_14]
MEKLEEKVEDDFSFYKSLTDFSYGFVSGLIIDGFWSVLFKDYHEDIGFDSNLAFFTSLGYYFGSSSRIPNDLERSARSISFYAGANIGTLISSGIYLYLKKDSV